MSAIQEFLLSLNEIELSFHFLYRHHEYTGDSRRLIDEELQRRQLTGESMVALIAPVEFQLTNTGCVRCNSLRPLVNNHCLVCGHNFQPNTDWSTTENFLDSIFRTTS